MSRFFNLFAGFCGFLFLITLLSGQFPNLVPLTSTQHMLLGLGTAILTVCLHCLIFAIFTGSGKDTRLLVEDLALEAGFVKRAKQLKHVLFPPALYAILLIIILTSLGGFASARPGVAWVSLIHMLAGWGTFAYNIKVFLIEARGVKANHLLIEEVNRVAAQAKPLEPSPNEVNPGAVEQFEWETHVYAMGKFLTFMGYNTWLPYLYLRFIVGNLRIPFLPFLVSSALFLVGGGFLRMKYRKYRPNAPQLKGHSPG